MEKIISRVCDFFFLAEDISNLLMHMTQEVDVAESGASVGSGAILGEVMSEEHVQLFALPHEDEAQVTRTLTPNGVDDAANASRQRRVSVRQRRRLHVDLRGARNAEHFLNL